MLKVPKAIKIDQNSFSKRLSSLYTEQDNILIEFLMPVICPFRLINSSFVVRAIYTQIMVFVCYLAKGFELDALSSFI